MNVDDYFAFVRSVVDSPADDTVRLAFADFLEENGQPVRAELIRLQVEVDREMAPLRTHQHWAVSSLDTLLDPQDRDQQEWKHRVQGLNRRASALLSRHDRELRTAVPDDPSENSLLRELEGSMEGLTWWNQAYWRRGLPEVVVCSYADAVHRGADEHMYGGRPTAWARAVCRHHPVLELRVDSTDPDVIHQDGVPWYGYEYHAIPDAVFNLMNGRFGARLHHYGVGTMYVYPSREEALKNLGLATATWVREHKEKS